MVAIPTSLLLEAWEQGRGASPGERGLLLLTVAQGDIPAAVLAGWTVGQRDAALLALREQLLGSQVAALVDCPRCGEPLEVEFPVAALAGTAAEASGGPLALESDGYRLLYRLPTAGDLAALGRQGGPAPARWLLERCVLQIDRPPGAAGEAQAAPARPSTADVPEHVFRALEAALPEAVAAADPVAEIELALACPACGAQWQTPFDIVSFLWQELDAWAVRLLSDVHILASHHGWSERDILALSPWRRQHYLDLIGA
jgi:hypothetical protein